MSEVSEKCCDQARPFTEVYKPNGGPHVTLLGRGGHEGWGDAQYQRHVALTLGRPASATDLI